MKRKVFFVFFKAIGIWGIVFGKEHPLPVKNFSVPTVTQIAPLISFGQLLIGKKALLPQLSGSYSQRHDSYSNTLAPNIIYGVRDNVSVFFVLPFNPKSKSHSSHSSGIEDILLQLEYGFFNRRSKEWTLQATLVGNVQFPTGSTKKNPRTGNGSFSYLLGPTFAYLSQHWYAFASGGVNLTTTYNATKFGNTYLYQWGFARYIKQLSPPRCIFDLMVEFDGAYAEKDKINGIIDANSGGNSIIVTPSIWVSSKSWILQCGIGFPLLQNLYGQQNKIDYVVAYTLAIAFQF